jgi:shikimate kinase
MERAWILIGMMGSGKSTVGKLLAEKADRTFHDTDQMVVHRLGRPIHQVFAVYGQDAFRDHETSILRGLQPGPIVLATGGGIVLREENWTELRRLGTVVFLDLPAELLIQRLRKSPRRRPLLEVEDWEDRLRTILLERRPLYERADLAVRIETENLEEAAQKLYESLSVVS